MSLYQAYLDQIDDRKKLDLQPKPIDDSQLTKEIVLIISDPIHKHKEKALDFFIYNILPGTTGAAEVKAEFLKSIICKEQDVEEISDDFAFDLLSHMK